MTDTAINTVERQARISGYWTQHRDWTFDQVAALVDTELAEEAAADAERAAYGQSMHDSLEAMWSCPCCGATAMNTALCPDCSRVATVIRNERAAAEKVQGRDRGQLVEAFLDRTRS